MGVGGHASSRSSNNGSGSRYWPGWVYFRLCALRDWYFKLQHRAMGGIWNPDLDAQLDDAIREAADYETFKRLRKVHAPISEEGK